MCLRAQPADQISCLEQHNAPHHFSTTTEQRVLKKYHPSTIPNNSPQTRTSKKARGGKKRGKTTHPHKENTRHCFTPPHKKTHRNHTFAQKRANGTARTGHWKQGAWDNPNPNPLTQEKAQPKHSLRGHTTPTDRQTGTPPKAEKRGIDRVGVLGVGGRGIWVFVFFLLWGRRGLVGHSGVRGGRGRDWATDGQTDTDTHAHTLTHIQGEAGEHQQTSTGGGKE